MNKKILVVIFIQLPAFFLSSTWCNASLYEYQMGDKFNTALLQQLCHLHSPSWGHL